MSMRVTLFRALPEGFLAWATAAAAVVASLACSVDAHRLLMKRKKKKQRRRRRRR